MWNRRTRSVAVWVSGLLIALGHGSPAARAQAGAVTIPVNSPAFAFSPGNWTGDAGRGGGGFRQTWYSGAYFRVAWLAKSAAPTATLLLDTSLDGSAITPPPNLAYNVDGVWTADVPCRAGVPINGLAGAGPHVLTVYVQNSPQRGRWGTAGASGANVVRVTGLQVDAGSTPGAAARQQKWALEIGDSITEGIQADNGKDDTLADYSYFVGQALQTRGYEYGVSACGYSGWLRPGDATGDVPGYYFIAGGKYDDARSRWDKIDGGHSLLDGRGHLSASGRTGQEPAIITINFGTNDALNHTDPGDTQAGVTQSLAALRRAAPQAQIFLIIPFGQYDAGLIRAGAHAYLSAHPSDRSVSLIDLGPDVARALAANGPWGGLHPNMRGHAVFAARIVAAIDARLETDSRKGTKGTK